MRVSIAPTFILCLLCALAAQAQSSDLLMQAKTRLDAGQVDRQAAFSLLSARNSALSEGDLDTLLRAGPLFLKFRDAGQEAALANHRNTGTKDLAEWELATTFEAAYEYAEKLHATRPGDALKAMRKVQQFYEQNLARLNLAVDPATSMKYNYEYAQQFVSLWEKEAGPSTVAAKPSQPPPRVFKESMKTNERDFSTAVNIKPMALGQISAYLKASEGKTLSSNFFSAGDRAYVLATLDSYLNGVAVDPDYLKTAAMKRWVRNLQGKSVDAPDGLFQPKGLGPIASAEELRYCGWIILARSPNLDQTTAYHEGVHAVCAAVGAGDDDDDEYLGPENLSAGFVRLVTDLRDTVDPQVEHVCALLAAGKEAEKEIAELRRLIRMRKSWMNSYEPQFYKCLGHVRGKADWEGYEAAIEARLEAARGKVGSFRAGDHKYLGRDFSSGRVTEDRLEAVVVPDIHGYGVTRIHRSGKVDAEFGWGAQVKLVKMTKAEFLKAYPDLRKRLRFNSQKVRVSSNGNKGFYSVGKDITEPDSFALLLVYRKHFIGLIEIQSGFPVESYSALKQRALPIMKRSMELIDLRFPTAPVRSL